MNDTKFKQIVKQALETGTPLDWSYTADARYKDVVAEIERKTPTQAETSTTVAVMEPKIDQVAEPASIPQPSNGEFASPLDGALWMAATYGIPQTPLKGKAPFLQNWPAQASTDPAQIRAWWEQYHCNFGSVGVLGRHFIFDADRPKDLSVPSIRERFKAQGHDFTSRLIVESSPGKGHRYYLSAPGISNISESAVQHSDFSLRVDGEQCVSPGSVHPTTGKQYRVAVHDGPLTQPTAEEIAFWNSERAEKKAAAVAVGEDIPQGKRNSTITSILGKARQATGADYDALLALARQHNQRCIPQLSDEDLQTIARSIAKYPVAPPPPPFVLGGKVLGQTQQVAAPETRTLEFVRGDSVKPVRLKWLWRGRILADKLNVFSGEPDVGKGMTTVDVAARITRHWDFPDAKNELNGPKDVIFLSSEDDMADTIVPRLKVAGADMSRIHFARISENIGGTLEEGVVCLDRDLPILEEMIEKYSDVVLIIPDPIIAFLGDADPKKDKDIRPIYSKMKSFAKRLNVAWLFVNHWNKNQNVSSINRTSGAKTMVSAPRATWMFSRSPEDPTRYLMMKGKGNLSKSGPDGVKTLAYRIVSAPFDFGDGRPPDPDGVPKLVWDGVTEHAVEEVLQEQADPKSRRNTKAEDLLVKLLAAGAVLAKDVYLAGDKDHLSSDQMKRARYRLGYVADKIDNRWFWAKSEEDMATRKLQFYAPGAKPVIHQDPDVDFGHVARVN